MYNYFLILWLKEMKRSIERLFIKFPGESVYKTTISEKDLPLLNRGRAN